MSRVRFFVGQNREFGEHSPELKDPKFREILRLQVQKNREPWVENFEKKNEESWNFRNS